tara:strand:+ start:65 stop:619 length:555 start_codon:yes stop_codon:yes gene_type:complete
MANPMYGQNKYDGEAQLAANEANIHHKVVVESAWSAITVTAATATTVTVTQPAKSMLLDCYVVFDGLTVVDNTNGDDLDFDLGTSANGGQLVDGQALYDNGGAALTMPANVAIPVIKDGKGAAVGDMLGYFGLTNEAMTISGQLYSSASRTLHASLIPIADALDAGGSFKVVCVFADASIVPNT